MKTAVPVFLVLSMALARADDHNLKLPEGPLLKRVSSPAQWTITTQLAPTSSAASVGSTDEETGEKGSGSSIATQKTNKPSLTTVIKSEGIIFEKTFNENGALIEIWRIAGWLVMNVNSSGWTASPSSGNTFNTTDYSNTDFAGFAWISLKNFSGRRDVNGKHCLIFKDKILTMDPQELTAIRSSFFLQYEASIQNNPHPPPPPVFDPNAYKVDVEADIDDETRLPVLLIYKTHEGLRTRRFDFQSASGSISPPPEVKALLQKNNEHQRRLTGGPAPI